jgi:hypothetical protein
VGGQPEVLIFGIGFNEPVACDWLLAAGARLFAIVGYYDCYARPCRMPTVAFVASAPKGIHSLDHARAESVVSLIIRRHRESADAFKALLNDLSKHRQESLSPQVA